MRSSVPPTESESAGIPPSAYLTASCATLCRTSSSSHPILLRLVPTNPESQNVKYSVEQEPRASPLAFSVLSRITPTLPEDAGTRPAPASLTWGGHPPVSPGYSTLLRLNAPLSLIFCALLLRTYSHKPLTFHTRIDDHTFSWFSLWR